MNWQQVSDTSAFGNLVSAGCRFFIGNFSGNSAGADELLFIHPSDKHWCWGPLQNGNLAWQQVSDTSSFGNLVSDGSLFFKADFNGTGSDQILFYDPPNALWGLGTLSAGNITWTKIPDTSGNGNLKDAGCLFFIGKFDAAGADRVLFFNPTNGGWFFGTFANNALTWTPIPGTPPIVGVLSIESLFFAGNFAGGFADQIVFYDPLSGQWLLGTLSAGTLNWKPVANTSGFGNLVTAGCLFFTGNFAGTSGSVQIAFFHPSDGNWFLGSYDGQNIVWNLVSNTSGFGNLKSEGCVFLPGVFNEAGSDKILFYHPADSHWFLATYEGGQFTWTLALDTTGFGNLVSSGTLFFTGNFAGTSDETDQILLYHPSDSHWWLGTPVNSLLVGFDMSLELSAAGLMQLLQQEISQLQAPQGITVTTSQGTSSLLLQSAELSITQGGINYAYVQITLQCGCGSLLGLFENVSFTAECGNILVSVKVDGTALTIDVDPTGSTVSITNLTLPRGTTPQNAHFISQQLTTGFTTTLVNIGQQSIQPGITVDPTQDGNPLTSTFTQLVAVFFTQGSLVLLENVYASSVGRGDPNQRTPQIEAGQDIVLSLGTQVFQQFMFCPALANILSETGTPVPTASMPTSCGSAASIHNSVSWLIVFTGAGAPKMGWLKEFIRATQGITWQSMAMALVDGAIQVNSAFSIQTFCLEISATTDLLLVPQIITNPNGTQSLQFAGSATNTSTDIASPWWCWALSAFDPTDLTGIALGLSNVLGPALAPALQLALSNSLSSGQSGGNAPALPFKMAIDSFDVTGEAVQVIASIPPATPASAALIFTVPAWSDAGQPESSTGEFVSTECPIGTFPYTLTFNAQELVLAPTTSGVVCPPFTITSWSIWPDNLSGDGSGINWNTFQSDRINLPGVSGANTSSGTITLTGVECAMPDLMLGWVETMSEAVPLDYLITATTLKLWNRLATNGTFNIRVWATAVDNDGTVFSGSTQTVTAYPANPQAPNTITVTGPQLSAPSYLQALSACPDFSLEELLELFDPQTVVSITGLPPVQVSEQIFRRMSRVAAFHPQFGKLFLRKRRDRRRIQSPR